MRFRGMAWDATDRREYPRADCGNNLFFTVFLPAHARGVICGVIARADVKARADARRRERASNVPDESEMPPPGQDEWSKVLGEYAERFEYRS